MLNDIEQEIAITKEIHVKGFSKAIRVFSVEEIDNLNHKLNDFIQSNKVADRWFSVVDVKDDKNLDVETIYDAHLKRMDISNILKNRKILNIAERVLGGDVSVWRTTFWIKEPGARRVEWHQDTYKDEGFGSFPNVNLWLAFDYAEKDNCMWFAEETHHSIIDLSSFKKESYVNTLKQSPQLPEPPIAKIVTKVKLDPGEGVFFDGKCLHGSPPNYSQHRRAGLVIRFIPKGYQLR